MKKIDRDSSSRSELEEMHRPTAPQSPAAAASLAAVRNEVGASIAATVSRRAAICGVAASAVLGAAGLSSQVTAPVSALSGAEPASPRNLRTADTFVAPSRLPEDFALPAPLQAVPLDPGSGFDLPIGLFRATFIPRASLLGPGGDPHVLLKEPLVIGMVITCLEKIWWIESEPAGGQAFTMVAYSAGAGPGEPDRTAILSGRGVVSPDGAGLVDFSLQTVTELARSDHHDQIVAAITSHPDGTYAGQVDVADYYGKGNGHGDCHHHCNKKSGTGATRCRRRCRRHHGH